MLNMTPSNSHAAANGRLARKMAEKVTLVVEHQLDTDPSPFMEDLVRLLDPTITEVTLIHAMSDILSGLPANPNEPKSFSNMIREREKRSDEQRGGIRKVLASSRYTLRNEKNCSMQEECAAQIADYLWEKGQDLLVISSSQPASQKLTLRSHFASYLATHAPCSTLVLRKPLLKNRKTLKVMLAVDSSDATMTAVSKLGDLIRPENMEVILVTVQSPMYSENAVIAPFVNPEVIDQAMAANANMVFQMASDTLEAKHIRVIESRKLIGSPATEIGYLAELEHPDLVVVGSHNKKGFLAWLTGSVSGQLLHWGNHNILVVR
ncbi:MAG TPA: universal stress protein [Coleofasciculaceae cyanobacterium]|jgi:nucleotide-binding universal stress UspA family protein